MAVLPQFMAADVPILPQLAVLAPTWALMAGIINGACALLAGGAAHDQPAGGGFLIGAGVLSAAMRRA